MVRKLFLLIVLISGSYVNAQQSDNKINPTDISISSKEDKSEQVPLNDKYMYADRINHIKRDEINKNMGKRSLHPYKITTSRYIARSNIKRSIGKANEVRIRIIKNGMDNTDIENFSMAYDSGMEFRMSNIYGIQNATFPLYIKVTYLSWNVFHAVQSDVVFELKIFSPGTWDVTLFN
jgi:transposase-like protein